MKSATEAAEERSSPGAWELVGKRLGRYEILHLLASGGMGAVFVGRARGAGGFERLVALKVLHRNLAHEEEFVSMFLDEARLAAQIHHPNVVATLDVASDRDGHYLVMEYVAGVHLGILTQIARKLEPIPVPIVVRITLDVLAGLAASHGLKSADGAFLNLIHRDVSPMNILVGADGITRLTDFGIAKAEARLSSTRKGEFKGKLAYAAPEQLSSHDETNQRSDLFSMGVVLWEALANRRLFDAGPSAGIVHQLLSEPIALLSSVRPELQPFDYVLERALKRNPAERFSTAGEMAAAVQQAAAEYEYDDPATPAVVAEFVEKAAAEKLEKERASIQRARTAFELLQATPPSDELLPLTVAATPTFIRDRGRSRSRRTLGLVVALVLLGMGGLYALWPRSSSELPAETETPTREAAGGADDAGAQAEQNTPNEQAGGAAAPNEQAGGAAAPNEQDHAAATPTDSPPSEPTGAATAPAKQPRSRSGRARFRQRTTTQAATGPGPVLPPAPSNPYE